MRLKLGLCIISFCFLIVLFGFKPVDKGETVTAVFYKMGVYPDNNNSKSAQLLDEYDKARENVEMILVFTKETSIYKIVNKLNLVDDLATQMAIIMVGGERYCNVVSKCRIEHTVALDEEFNVVLPFDEYKWVITNETKKINGYTCYKATSHTEEYSKFRKRPITMDPVVWFAPELPFSFGPAGLDGLPGLVLEGSVNGKTYFYATKIVFDYKDSKVDFEKPKKGKYITASEYENLLISGVE